MVGLDAFDDDFASVVDFAEEDGVFATGEGFVGIFCGDDGGPAEAAVESV